MDVKLTDVQTTEAGAELLFLSAGAGEVPKELMLGLLLLFWIHFYDLNLWCKPSFGNLQIM